VRTASLRARGVDQSGAGHERAAVFLESVHEGTWTLIPVSEGVLRAVNALIPELPDGVFLRAGDAIHLVTASQAGFPEVWTNDATY
jgi:predicted nucleic acid-binding protein